MIKIIIAIVIFLTINVSAKQKFEQDYKNGRVLSCVELDILYYTREGVKKDIN